MVQSAVPVSLKTGEITSWISKIKCKKMTLKRQKRKNLLVEAVLARLLDRAERELKEKQRQRLQRWRSIKSSWMQSENLAAAPSVWDTRTCEELECSLDKFMSQLKDIKVPVER